MALDRFIYWGKKRPTKKQLAIVLTDYLGGVGECTWGGGRWTCTLLGRPTLALRSLYKTFADVDGDMADMPRVRWFEVFWGKGNIDVITRQADDYTNAVAEGFTALCARHWQGRRET